MAFTAEQLHAIEGRTGELLLDAGAGSGKTSVLVERFFRAVEDDGIGIHQILTITFTEKAAAELRERIRARFRTAGQIETARATETAWISTIHGFCARLLRNHALEAGIDPDFAVLDDARAAELRSGALDQALTASARTPQGAQLIGAYGTAPLRSTIARVHDELRARGILEPRLPPAPEPPPREDLLAACRLVEGVAGAAQRELGAVADPGPRISEALALLGRVPSVLESGPPWPGELGQIRLGTGALALRTRVCDDYREALDELADMAAHDHAVGVRDALDALLSEYGRRYAALKRARSGLDFSDLELMARDLLRRDEVRGRYRERFLRVMVDEMQDTNGVQLELIDLIAGPDLFMVGDAQQSIYGFRHADVELFERRGAQLDQSGGRASLQTNFRSHAAILRVLNAAFADALGESFRPLLPGLPQTTSATDPLVELLVVDKDAIASDFQPDDPMLEQPAAPWRVAEAMALAARLRELIDSGEVSPADVVVLLRATTDIHVYEAALVAVGLPSYVVGGRGYWSHPQVIELIAYLRALANPLDTEALYTVLRSPICGLSLDGLVLHAADAPSEQLAGPDLAGLEAFYEWFGAERRAAAWLGAEQLLERVLLQRGYELRLARLPDARRRLANVRKLLRLAREWQAEHGTDLRGFIDLLQSRSGGEGAAESHAPVESEALDAVRLMTIHRSKGLEFPVVCVADLGRQVMPRAGSIVRLGRDRDSLGLRLRNTGSAGRVDALAYDELKVEERERESAEERRLFYVAMTRAQQRLIVSGAAKLEAWEAGNRLAPISWVGAALVPDIASRASNAWSAATAAALPAATATPALVTELGVKLTFVTSAPDHPPAEPPATDPQAAEPPNTDPQADSVDVIPAGGGKRRQSDEPSAPRPRQDRATTTTTTASTPVPPTSLSYSALTLYEDCGYRFYAERVLGLPQVPAGAEPTGVADPPPLAAEPSPPAARSVGGTERGTLIHQLLAGLDLRGPTLSESMPDDVRALLLSLIGSPTFSRLTGLREIRREQRFAFAHGEVVISGVFDVLARDTRGDRLLVIDYKSDRLGASAPETIVAERYGAQRTIYALATLNLGAADVEVVHLFLEAPDEPAKVVYTQSDRPALERELDERLGGIRSGDFRVTESPGRHVCDGCPAEGGLCSHPLELTRR